MSGGAVAGAVLGGVGSVMNAGSGPISSAINARMYKKYGLHEPEYLAASQRAAGINPLLANGGSLGEMPAVNLGETGDLAAGVTKALEVKAMKENASILRQKAEQAINENAISYNNMRISGMNADLMQTLGHQEKMANLNLTNATAAKLSEEAKLLKYKKEEGKADAEFWKAVNNDPNVAAGTKGLQTIIKMIKGR